MWIGSWKSHVMAPYPFSLPRLSVRVHLSIHRFFALFSFHSLQAFEVSVRRVKLFCFTSYPDRALVTSKAIAVKAQIANSKNERVQEASSPHFDSSCRWSLFLLGFFFLTKLNLMKFHTQIWLLYVYFGYLGNFLGPRSLGSSETDIQPVSSERKSQWQWGRGRRREREKALPWQTSRCPSMFTQRDVACLPDHWGFCHPMNECNTMHRSRHMHTGNPSLMFLLVADTFRWIHFVFQIKFFQLMSKL